MQYSSQMESFINNLRISNFSTAEIDYILQSGIISNLKKGEVFSIQGKAWDKIAIIQKGILGGWETDKNFEKKFIQFYYLPNNYVVVDYECFVKNIISQHTIEALDDCVLLEFSRETFTRVKERFPKFLEVEKILAQRQYLEAQKLINLFRNFNAAEILKIVRENAPEILAKVPYSYVASFLGLHRNTFAEAMKKL